MTTDPFKYYITELLEKYSTEDLVLDETFKKIVYGELGSTKLLEEFIEKNPWKKEEVLLAVKILKEVQFVGNPQSDEKKIEIWEKIVENKKRQNRFRYLGIAALFFLIIGIGGTSIYYFTNEHNSVHFIAAKETPENDVSLILSDGKKVDLDNHQSEVHYTADGALFLMNDTTVIDQIVNDEVINQLIVPYGKRANILLSDGTKVWLNAGSKLAYPPCFSGKKIREVYLEGEGYFDVAKNPDKPFFVKTDAFSIKVFGTRFNVTAYKQGNQYNTVLVEGKISLNLNRQLFTKDVILAPDQQAQYSEGDSDFRISEVTNTLDYIAWTEGYLYLNNDDFTGVINRISRYYNITIECSIEGEKPKISGKLDLKDDPEKVLKGLSIISGTTLLKQEKKYLLYE